MLIRKFLFLIGFLASAMASTAGLAQSHDMQASACTAFANAYFGNNKYEAMLAQIPDAPTTVISAKVIAAGGDGSAIQDDLPEYCRIEAQITPTIGVLIRMPTKNWNGKMLMGGCGGPCGNYLEDRVDPGLVRGYATVNTDMGHKGIGWGFGYNNVQGQIDFGFRATHLTAEVGKVVVGAYYGQAPKRNYFMGCSTGGRQGLIEAQRFPKDFDGILAGAPPVTQTGWQSLVQNWAATVNNPIVDGKRKQILSPSKLPMIHNAVLKKCDAIDGLKDGVLQNPLLCNWEPKEIQCKGATTPDCLSAEEVKVVEKIYQGATWSDGKPMYYGNSGIARGTELKWAFDLEPPVGTNSSQAKYWGVGTSNGPTYDDTSVDIDRDIPRLAMLETLYHHTNPDLRNFKTVGGKLIFYGGWDDTCCRANGLIDYYEMVTRTMGGLKATQDFMRLFLPSGMDHCRYGIGGGEVDWLTALENWVEKGQAPEQVIAHHMLKEPYPSKARELTDSGGPYAKLPRHPLQAGTYDRAHPVYPYPDWPKYSGNGNSNDPATWVRMKGDLKPLVN